MTIETIPGNDPDPEWDKLVAGTTRSGKGMALSLIHI